jgi:hypothetical protein
MEMELLEDEEAEEANGLQSLKGRLFYIPKRWRPRPVCSLLLVAPNTMCTAF